MIFQHNSEADFKKKLFELAASGTYFLFQGTFYNQIDSATMGSPLGPVLANLFMGY